MITESAAGIHRISDDVNRGAAPRAVEYHVVRDDAKQVPAGFGGYLFLEKPKMVVPCNSFLIGRDFSYLNDGDIVRIDPHRGLIRVLYRRRSSHNAVLLTERCNNFCLMCSQPPKDIDDSYIVSEVLQMIPLMSQETREIAITGGEPTLLGSDLIRIIECFKRHLPTTALHMLSNGRAFNEWGFAKMIAESAHPDLVIGIPLYSDISSLHDHVVQADGAFDDTIRGIINLKSVGVRIEIRVVIHRLTWERLPDLARFIRRNLTFCDHVAFMGLEMTGFTKANLETLWIDPKDYQGQLRKAVELLVPAKIPMSIYNHQLCILDPRLVEFNRKSISDWKNEYMPECEECVRKQDCGGFFSSARLRYSKYISPFHD